jgi:cell division protein FtsL
MAQAARRIEHQAQRRRGAHLVVVPPARIKRPAARKPARAAARDARVRGVFTVVVLAVAFAGIGLLRVSVVARATEMTLAEGKLAASIKTQRIETDRLELDRSSLATPSRIEEIAGATMGMGKPASVSYMTMPSTAAVPVPGDSGATGSNGARDEAAGAGGRALAGVLGALADMSAIEAQALLVGDVGLTGSR